MGHSVWRVVKKYSAVCWRQELRVLFCVFSDPYVLYECSIVIVVWSPYRCTVKLVLQCKINVSDVVHADITLTYISLDRSGYSYGAS